MGKDHGGILTQGLMPHTELCDGDPAMIEELNKHNIFFGIYDRHDGNPLLMKSFPINSFQEEVGFNYDDYPIHIPANIKKDVLRKADIKFSSPTLSDTSSFNVDFSIKYFYSNGTVKAVARSKIKITIVSNGYGINNITPPY